MNIDICKNCCGIKKLTIQILFDDFQKEEICHFFREDIKMKKHCFTTKNTVEELQKKVGEYRIDNNQNHYSFFEANIDLTEENISNLKIIYSSCPYKFEHEILR